MLITVNNNNVPNRPKFCAVDPSFIAMIENDIINEKAMGIKIEITDPLNL